MSPERPGLGADVGLSALAVCFTWHFRLGGSPAAVDNEGEAP